MVELGVIAAIYEAVGGGGSPIMLLVVGYCSLGYFIYKMNMQLNYLKKNVNDYQKQTTEDIQSIKIEFKAHQKEIQGMSMILYKIAGKLDVDR